MKLEVSSVSVTLAFLDSLQLAQRTVYSGQVNSGWDTMYISFEKLAALLLSVDKLTS